MTEWEFEDMLPRAISYAAAADFDDIPDTPEPDWSKTYRRKRAKFLRDPFAFVRRRAVPHWKHLLRVAACLLLVATLSLAALCLVNSEVRAKIYRWFTRLYESHAEYEFSGGQLETDLPQYTLSYLPGGYEFVFSEDLITSYYWEYRNTEQDKLYLCCFYAQQGVLLTIMTENMEISEVQVNGEPGLFYQSLRPEKSSALVWADEESDTTFQLDGFLSKEEMLKIAEGVKRVK